MSYTGWNTQQTTKKLERVLLKQSLKLEIPDDILDKIKYLCQQCPKDEWSGLLFYEVEGTISTPSGMKMIIKDLFLMDIGNKVHTAFKWENDIVQYRMDNPESLDWIVGHIHSHNDMTVYFSHTDWDELNDNSPKFNFYLSLIVNNWGDMCAKVAMAIVPNQFSYKNELGQDKNMTINNFEFDPLMLVYECDINKSTVSIEVENTFSSRFVTVQKAATQRMMKANAEKAALAKKNAVKNPAVTNSYTGGTTTSNNKTFDDWGSTLAALEDDLPMTMTEEFACFVLRLGNPVVDEDLIDTIEQIEASGVQAKGLANSIADMYNSCYDNFYEKEEGYGSTELYLEVLEGVIKAYEEHADDFSFLEPVMSALREVGTRVESDIETIKGVL